MVLPRQSLSIFVPFLAAPGVQHHHFRIPLLALRNLGFFPASPPQFTPAVKRWSLTSNVTPTLKWSSIYRGNKPVTLHPTGPLTLKRLAMSGHPTFYKVLLRHSQPPTSPYTVPPCHHTLKCWAIADPILLALQMDIRGGADGHYRR